MFLGRHGFPNVGTRFPVCLRVRPLLSCLVGYVYISATSMLISCAILSGSAAYASTIAPVSPCCLVIALGMLGLQNQEHGHAKIIRCLEDNLEQPGFNATCKAEVQKHAANAATDYRWAAQSPVLCADGSQSLLPLGWPIAIRGRCVYTFSKNL